MAIQQGGGPFYIGTAPASEQIPEHDATIDDNHIIESRGSCRSGNFEAIP
jgi:hypothetical protein